MIQSHNEYNDVTFKTQNLNKLEFAVFYDCVFEGCVWREAHVRACRFVDCVFESCDLSMVNLLDSAFAGVTFEDCELVGVNFSQARHSVSEPLDMRFNGCRLAFASFTNMTLDARVFEDCALNEALFLNTSLVESDFSGSDLSRAQFDNCDLSNADFRTAKNYMIDVYANKLKQARFRLPEVMNLLAGLPIRIED